MSASEVNLPVPEFVSQIAKDPNKSADVVLLSGFPGPASESGHTRLYLNPQLSQYVEIPNEAVVHFQPVRSESSPQGGVYVWIQREAQLVRTKAGPERAQARFFEGPIAQEAGEAPTQTGDASIGGVHPAVLAADAQYALPSAGQHEHAAKTPRRDSRSAHSLKESIHAQRDQRGIATHPRDPGD
jgi:hypothetical protein